MWIQLVFNEIFIAADYSYEEAYDEFLSLSSEDAEQAELYRALHKEKHVDVPIDPGDKRGVDSDEEEEEEEEDICDEARILRDHPCTEKGEIMPGYSLTDVMKQQRNQHFEEELDAFLASGGGFAGER